MAYWGLAYASRPFLQQTLGMVRRAGTHRSRQNSVTDMLNWPCSEKIQVSEVEQQLIEALSLKHPRDHGDLAS